ncbi:hypothetical protein NPL3_01680 [Metamycoplasma hyosynoviae]|nr:hypothetical protein NPL3_01680 [Metamycoplasma hyosynoviae]
MMKNYSKYRNKTYKFIDKFSHFKLVKCLLLFHIFAMLKKQKNVKVVLKKKKIKTLILWKKPMF